MLLAAGVGITPMNSMLHYSITRTPPQAGQSLLSGQGLQHGRWTRGSCLCGQNEWLSHRDDDQPVRTVGIGPTSVASWRVPLRSYRRLAVVNEVNATDAHYFLCGLMDGCSSCEPVYRKQACQSPKSTGSRLEMGIGKRAKQSTQETHQVSFPTKFSHGPVEAPNKYLGVGSGQ